jgi:hypothetical protein
MPRGQDAFKQKRPKYGRFSKATTGIEPVYTALQATRSTWIWLCRAVFVMVSWC